MDFLSGGVEFRSGVDSLLCSLVGFTKTNTELFLLRHMTTLTSIQAGIIFFKDISYFKHNRFA